MFVLGALDSAVLHAGSLKCSHFVPFHVSEGTNSTYLAGPDSKSSASIGLPLANQISQITVSQLPRAHSEVVRRLLWDFKTTARNKLMTRETVNKYSEEMLFLWEFMFKILFSIVNTSFQHFYKAIKHPLPIHSACVFLKSRSISHSLVIRVTTLFPWGNHIFCTGPLPYSCYTDHRGLVVYYLWYYPVCHCILSPYRSVEQCFTLHPERCFSTLDQKWHLAGVSLT